MSRVRFAIAALVVISAVGAATVASARDATFWGSVRRPSRGSPESIGEYSAGCVRGAKKLALSGPGYQVMRPSRRRHFGHPRLVKFVRNLGQQLKRKGLGVLLVGDLSQPRGGPAPNGHASHQSGLDVDLWYWYPPEAASRRLTRSEREKLSARSVADLPNKEMTADWSPRIVEMLRIAASDDAVARVFVNPLIKRELCRSSTGDREWLRKLRPWWGHHTHFHVRLACPPGNEHCVPQGALPQGDGCAEIDWWLDEQAQQDRQKRQAKYRSKIASVPELPQQCQRLRAAGTRRRARRR